MHETTHRGTAPGTVRVLTAALVCAAAAGVQAAPAPAPAPASTEAPAPLRNETLPPATEALEIEQKLDAQVPLDVPLVDERGNPVTLADYVGGERPILLSLVYYECPMLCNLVLDGMIQTLREVDLRPGSDFELVTVSIDPTEKPVLAQQKKQAYGRAYGKPGIEAGWHVLTGPAASSRAIADAVGFPYRYLPERGEYSHPAALFVLTPEGRVSRYLFGIRHDPQTVRLSLVEASDGKIGSPVDSFLLYCYRYDADEGTYASDAWRIARLALGGFAIVFGAVLFTFWRRDAGRKGRT